MLQRLGGRAFALEFASNSAQPFERPIAVGSARLDNAPQVRAALGADSPALPENDFSLVAAAWKKWGNDFCQQVAGDWWLGAWNPLTRELLLARDHFGNVGLHYCREADRVVFAPDLPDVLRNTRERPALDWDELGWFLLTSSVSGGSDTCFAGVRRVPPGHALLLRPQGDVSWCHWKPESVRPWSGGEREGPESLRTRLVPALTQAVKNRLGTDRATAVALSSGMDSSAILALGAPLSRRAGIPLFSVTAVPIPESLQETPEAVVCNEGPIAARFARSLGIPHHEVVSEAACPIGALREALKILVEPLSGAGATYWMLELLKVARQRGASTLLTGQTGDFVMAGQRPRASVLARCSEGRWRDALRMMMPYAVLTLQQAGWSLSSARRPPWQSYSLISDELVRSRRLMDRMQDMGFDPRFLRPCTRDPGMVRWQSQMPIGAWWSTLGRAFGMSVADPFQDRTVMELMFGLPPELRRLGRRQRYECAVEPRLPDEVLSQRQKARQSWDLLVRLRLRRSTVEELLLQIGQSPEARVAIDVERARTLWRTILHGRHPEARSGLSRFMVMCSIALLLLDLRELTSGVDLTVSADASGGPWCSVEL